MADFDPLQFLANAQHIMGLAVPAAPISPVIALASTLLAAHPTPPGPAVVQQVSQAAGGLEQHIASLEARVLALERRPAAAAPASANPEDLATLKRRVDELESAMRLHLTAAKLKESL